MTAGARYGLGVALTAIGLVLASAGLVSLVDGGGRSGAVAPIALDETASDTAGDAAGGDGAADGTGGDTDDGSGRSGTRDRGGVAIGPAGPASGDVDDDSASGDVPSTNDPSRTTARARSTSDRGTGPDPVAPTADPVDVPVGAAGTPDVIDVSPDEAPPADDPPAPTPDPAPTRDPAPTTGDPEPGPGRPTPAPEPTEDEDPVDEPVRDPASADCDRGPDWPWAERAGNQGRGQGHGPPVGGCRGGSAVGVVATVLAAPTPLGVHWVVRMLFG